MKSDEQILTELARAADGLLYMSETDAPFEPVLWAGDDELTPEVVRRCCDVDENVPVETQSLDELFRVAVAEPEWKGADQFATACRFQTLVQLLRDNLTDLRVFRLGRINMDVYVVGRAPSGNWLGLRTQIVET
jgi:Nuclease A inhibitor-like protein